MSVGNQRKEILLQDVYKLSRTGDCTKCQNFFKIAASNFHTSLTPINKNRPMFPVTIQLPRKAICSLDQYTITLAMCRVISIQVHSLKYVIEFVGLPKLFEIKYKMLHITISFEEFVFIATDLLVFDPSRGSKNE